MLGFERTVLPTNYVKVWAHGFAQQEGRTKGREDLVSWWCSSPAKVASGEVGQQRRSRGRVASCEWLQRADAAPELVARTLGPRWCSTERSLLSGLRRGEGMEEIGRGRDEFRRRAKRRAKFRKSGGTPVSRDFGTSTIIKNGFAVLPSRKIVSLVCHYEPGITRWIIIRGVLIWPRSLPLPNQNISSYIYHIKSFDACMEH
jgi:hypothetical protein